MFAHNHGQLWNASRIASAFGVSYHTINHYVDLLEKYFLIRRLIPYHQNVGKRLVKRHKLYYRDTGPLHFLLNLPDVEALRTSPYRGFSFEGFVIEQLIQKYLKDALNPLRFYFYKTSQGEEIDLLVQEGNNLTAHEIKTSTTIEAGELKGFQRSMEQLKLKKGIVVYFGKENFRLSPQIEVKSAESLLA